ncbi:hypothetical protein DFJ63DRAFT_316038 [Scheffersomyces coipomensis]|uniref:uncharacterized protein n=1 Tax=Scheffersomyces coipomensis TaxID=1788519 RepID=UPI00315CB0FF
MIIFKRMLRTGTSGVRVKAFTPKNTIFTEFEHKKSAYDLIVNNLEDDEDEPIIIVPPKILRGAYQISRSNEMLFSPKTEFYRSKHINLRIMGFNDDTNKYDVDLFKPVDILKTKFLTSLTKRNEIFASPTRQFVRYLFLIELLGRSIFREIVMRMALYKDITHPDKEFKRIMGRFNQTYYYTDDFRLYMDYNDPNSKLIHDDKILDLNIGSKHRHIIPSFTHLGFKYLENETNMMELSKRIIDSCSSSDKSISSISDGIILQQSLQDFKSFVEPALIRNTQYLTINNSLFATTKRRHLLPKFKGRLPPLMKLTNPTQTSFLLKASFIDTKFTHWDNKTQYKLHKTTVYLDKLGDHILKRLVVEYLIQLLDRNTNYVASTTDFYFLISNPLFGRLAMIYDLHKGLIHPDHQRQFEANLNAIEDTTSVSKIYRRYEVLGDLFERLVAVYYLDNEQKCREWVFKVFDHICDELMVNERGFLVLDKQRYIDESVADAAM